MTRTWHRTDEAWHGNNGFFITGTAVAEEENYTTPRFPYSIILRIYIAILQREHSKRMANT